MPKSNAESVRAYKARKRQQARTGGLCISCFKQSPHESAATCKTCSASSSVRKKRSRQRIREAAQFQPALAAYERAGDAARSHHAYELAVQHYKDALHMPASGESEIRLMEKLAEVVVLGNNPSSVNEIHDRLLAIYRTHPERSAEHVETLFRIALQLWVDSRTQDRLAVLGEVIRIAELSGDRELLQRANVGMATTLTQMERFEEADGYLRVIDELRDGANLVIDSGYHMQKGFVAAGFGREKEAFASFDRSIAILGEDKDSYRTATVWSNYGIVAMMFGRTRLAKSHHEHALVVARRSGIGWLIPACCLWYSQLLTCIGEYSSARDYLVEALSSDAQTHVLDEMIVSIGIPLALYMKDEVTLRKCVRSHVIDRIFASGEPLRAGRAAVAFARLYSERGQSEQAQAVLHRAMEAMHTAHEALDVPSEVARFGDKADFPKARSLLEARVALPGAHVARAYLFLFDAFVAQRDGRFADAHMHAREAAARFDEFGWSTTAGLARSLLPSDERQELASGLDQAKPFSDTHAKFTEREREVAALILKGLSNRAMAGVLALSENTVEKHVASVMDKLGIRSRYQVADHLTDSVMRNI